VGEVQERDDVENYAVIPEQDCYGVAGIPWGSAVRATGELAFRQGEPYDSIAGMLDTRWAASPDELEAGPVRTVSIGVNSL
jgi:hypothetical protein